MVERFEKDNLSNVVLLSTAGSASIVSGLFKKRIEERSNQRYQLFNFLLEKNANRWGSPPSGHIQVETARFNMHIPEAVLNLPKNTNIVIVDSIWITGDTMAKLRQHLHKFSQVKVYFLLQITSHAPGNEPPDFSAYESYNSNIMFPWGPAS